MKEFLLNFCVGFAVAIGCYISINFLIEANEHVRLAHSRLDDHAYTHRLLCAELDDLKSQLSSLKN